MIKQLKQLLNDHAIKPMKEIRTVLDNAIVDWMKDVNQIDDILVIGVRV